MSLLALPPIWCGRLDMVSSQIVSRVERLKACTKLQRIQVINSPKQEHFDRVVIRRHHNLIKVLPTSDTACGLNMCREGFQNNWLDLVDITSHDTNEYNFWSSRPYKLIPTQIVGTTCQRQPAVFLLPTQPPSANLLKTNAQDRAGRNTPKDCTFCCCSSSQSVLF